MAMPTLAPSAASTALLPPSVLTPPPGSRRDLTEATVLPPLDRGCEPGAMQASDRVDPPYRADERATLTALLDYHRDTLAWKCDGLTDAQLRTRAVSASNLSLLGLVRHMAEVERSWFRHGVAREV